MTSKHSPAGPIRTFMCTALRLPACLYLFVILIVASDTSVLILLQSYFHSAETWKLVAILCGYVVLCVSFSYALRYEGLGIVNVLWVASSLILVTAVGVLHFGVRPTPTEWAGIICILIGVIILRHYESKPTLAHKISAYRKSR